MLLSDGEPNPWGSGLGLAAGYTLPNAIYLGGAFEYFFGGSADDVYGRRFSSNIWQLSAEGGYDLGLGEHFVVRPKLGFGLASARSPSKTALSNRRHLSDGVVAADSSRTKPLLCTSRQFRLFTRHLSLSFDRATRSCSPIRREGLIFSAGIGF